MIAPAITLAAAFNLVCSIDTEQIGGKWDADKHSPVEYRVDLSEGRFCAGDCEQVRTIAKVESGMLYLLADRWPEGANKEYIEINRENGRYMWVLSSGEDAVRMIGRCERAPFTGFPDRKF